MSQKEIEEQQRKILFARFQEGTLLPDMNAVYIKEKTAKPAESAESVPYDYQFDFKYLLGNYYKAYRGDGYYNDKKAGCAEIKELEGENISAPHPILLWYIYKEIDKKENIPFDCDSWNG